MLVENFQIRYAELGENGDLPVWVLQNYIQESAAKDAKTLSAGWEDLSQKGIAWVLAKLEIKVFGKIKTAQSLSVKTWHCFSDKIKSRRDFEIFDENGAKTAAALSWWIVIDLETRKIVKTPQSVLDRKGDLITAIEENPAKQPKFDESVKPEKTIEIVSRLEDIDLNGHVNNVHFSAWAIESAPEQIRREKTLSDIIVNFKSEITAGEKIIVKTYRADELSFWHILSKESDSKEIASIYTKWS